MPDFTIVNLKEIENATSDGQDIEARMARARLGSRELGVSYFRYGPNHRARIGHRHREQEEAYIVVGGSGRIRLDDEIVELRRWDVVRIAPRVARALEGGPDGLEIIAVGGSRPADGDGEPLDGFWED